jgi:hypothetical protein
MQMDAFKNLLINWPISVLKDVDIATVFPNEASRRYAAVNRALKNGSLKQLRRGAYVIGQPYQKTSGSTFQMAHAVYGPSYISFESALFYHQWIPEAVYTTTCATAKRACKFETPFGLFTYTHVPKNLCYLGVQRMGTDSEAFFIAHPWKAIADHYYVNKRKWKSLNDITLDLRIELEDMFSSDIDVLQTLSEHYQSSRVRRFLIEVLGGIKCGTKNH